MFTEEILKKSNEFDMWITGRVAIIHDLYDEDSANDQTFIILHSTMGKWTITRFIMTSITKSKNNIYVSNDYVDISTEEAFELLLSEYSCRLS